MTDAQKVQAALTAAVNQTRRAVDIAAMIEALASKDRPAILGLLGIADRQFPALNDALSEQFSSLLGSAFSDAARSIAERELTADLLQHGQELRSSIINELTASSAKGIIESLDTALKLNLPAQTIVDMIGLSDRQAKSLTSLSGAIEQLGKDQLRFTSTLTIGESVSSETTIISGLSPQQTRFLSASQRSALNKALQDGLSPERIDNLLRKQADILLQHRTRTAAEFQLARVREEAKQQAAQSVQNAGELRRFWITAGDERVRHAHTATAALNPAGVAVNQPFKTPLGPAMNPPLEVNCRCHVEYRRPNGSRL